MRAIFGLVGLLVTVAIVIWLFAQYTSTVSSRSTAAQEQVAEMAGRDLASGAPVSESAKLEILTSGGQPDSVLVSKVVPGGAYARHFGLQNNDTILQIGPLTIRDMIKSREDAEAFLQDAYQRKQQLVVVRGGQQITLPQAPPQAAPPSGTPSGKDPLEQQLEGIGARRGL